MLKKIFISILALLALCVIGYFGYYQYRSSQSCPAVVTPGRSVFTGHYRFFPSPCYVPPFFYVEDMDRNNDIVISQ
jgi:hypothetical protein